jgi:hypothetical protein
LGILGRIAENPKAPAQARVKACETLMAYGFGRPHATVGLDEESMGGAIMICWSDTEVDPPAALEPRILDLEAETEE